MMTLNILMTPVLSVVESCATTASGTGRPRARRRHDELLASLVAQAVNICYDHLLAPVGVGRKVPGTLATQRRTESGTPKQKPGHTKLKIGLRRCGGVSAPRPSIHRVPSGCVCLAKTLLKVIEWCEPSGLSEGLPPPPPTTTPRAGCLCFRIPGPD